VLGVGDLHVENFGTWRDADGRLVWGVNDVDEAAMMPYTLDLVRLATSALLANERGRLRLKPRQICQAILQGYQTAVATGGMAFVLEEHHPVLRGLALSADEPGPFWAKMEGLSPTTIAAPLRRLLTSQMPAADLQVRILRRSAGIGSLGRPRVVALATWAGGLVAREAKALLPSAYAWAMGQRALAPQGAVLLARAVRCPDPSYRIKTVAGRPWVIRRLAPHCARIELRPKVLADRDEEQELLAAMGAETANLHLGTPRAAAAIRADLRHRKPRWLEDAATAMLAATMRDWTDFRAHAKP
jgi:hypothetical protein